MICLCVCVVGGVDIETVEHDVSVRGPTVFYVLLGLRRRT